MQTINTFLKRFILLIGVSLFTPGLQAQFLYEDQFGATEGVAKLSYPYHVAIDDNGNMYVTDWEENQVKVLDPSGNLLRQFGSEGYGNGEFKGVKGIALDGENNIYVTDFYNNRVQKFDQYGNFLMKFNVSEHSTGETNQPNGLDIGPDGKIYVCLGRKSVVEVYSAAGIYIEDIGTPFVDENEGLTRPQDVSIDDQSNIYVIAGNEKMTKFDKDGNFLMKIEDDEGYGSGNGQFWNPEGIDVGSDGKIYVSESWNHRVQIFDASGNYLNKFGSMGDGNNQFDFPLGMELDKNDNIYVCDPENQRIQKFTSSGSFLASFGNWSGTDGSLALPLGITIDGNGNLLVADTENERIQKYDANGNHLETFNGSDNNLYDGIWDVTDIYASNTDFFVVSTFNKLAQKFDANANNLLGFGNSGLGGVRLEWPNGILEDQGGNIWVTDVRLNVVKKYDKDGNFLSEIGGQGTGNGKFNKPMDVAMDAAGNLYITDMGNHRVQVFNSNGVYQRQFGSKGTGNGQFNQPAYITLDDADNIYVSEWGNHRVQKFSNDGSFIAKIGSEGTGNAQFKTPAAIAVSSSDEVYVVDKGNNRVQIFSQATLPTPGSVDGFEFLDGSGSTVSGYSNVTSDVTEQLSNLSSSLNFKAITSGNVDRVDWILKKAGVTIAQNSDNNADYKLYESNAISVEANQYELSATPYVSGQKGTAKTILINITASADPDFLISTDQSGSVIIYQGQAETVDVSITAVNGFNSAVTFSISGTTPSGLSTSFTPSSVTGSGSTGLELSASASAELGGTSISVEATSGGKTHVIDIPIAIEEVPEPDFRLEGDATQVTATTSNPGMLVLDIVRLHGHTGEITFTTDDLPTGVTAEFSPSSLSGSETSSNLTLTVDNTVTSSDGFFTVTASSGSIERSWRVMLSVVNEDPPGYTLTFSPDSVTIQRGTSGMFTILINRTGNYTEDVTMSTSASYLVDGATLSYDKPAFTGDVTSITATLDIPSDADVKTYNGNIYSNPKELGIMFKIHPYSVIVTDTPVESDFSIASSVQSITVTQGQSSNSINISLTPLGSFNEKVDFTAENLPSGVTAAFSSASLTGSGSTSLTLSASESAALGTSDITIKGTASSGIKTITIQLQVNSDGTSTISKETESSNLIYPNPAQNILNIQSETIIQQINIYSVQGELMTQDLFNSSKIRINVSGLNNGYYLVEILTKDGKRKMEKIIKY
jgi:tripartite motif-containing protein 71